MISLHQVHKSYGRQDVLNGASLQVAPGDRIGLVGPNGSGKSTILALLLGQVEPDRGDVFSAKGLRLGYLPQELIRLAGKSLMELALDTGEGAGILEARLLEVHEELAASPSKERTRELLDLQGSLMTRFENMGGYDSEARAAKVLSGLGFAPDQFSQDVATLSGGWLMRAALARILLSAPDLILLDEPTNHLDMESLLWLEGQLIKNPASLILVSHDRAFLDRVATRIVEVDGGQLYTYGGNYSSYEEQRQARIKAQEAAYRAQQERIKDIQRFIDKNRVRKDRAKQVQGRLKQLEKMDRLEPPGGREAFHLELPHPDRSAKVVCELLQVDFAYDGDPVYQGLDFRVERGDRLALLGRNGEGKSTLMKLLAGILAPDRGRRVQGGRVKTGFFSQHTQQDLNSENDVLNELGTVCGLMPLSRQRSILGTFLFKGEAVFKKVKVLSGGERARLVLAKLLVQAPNFLLLDEPTSHLDLESRKVLEKALQDFAGTLVLVSHDRRLINAAANKVAHVAHGQATIFPGNFSDFMRLWKDRLTAPEDPSPPPTHEPWQAPSPTGPRSNNKAARRAQAEARNARYQRLKPLKDEFARVEAQVEEVTARLDDLVAKMVDKEAYHDTERWSQLSKAHAEAQGSLERLTVRWEELAVKLEEAEADPLPSPSG